MKSNIEMPRYFAIVPAAGVGSRMGISQPKQYLRIQGKTILEHTIERLLGEDNLHTIVLVLSGEDKHWQSLTLLNNKKIKIVEGGQTRSQSVLNGLHCLSNDCCDDDWVLVHDVARPCITSTDIQKLISALADDPVGGIIAVSVIDTIKQVADDLTVTATVDRSILWQAQTPQMFRYRLLYDSLRQALAQGLVVTDEASAVESSGATPKIVEGSRSNIKITHPDDLPLAEFYLQHQRKS